MNQRCNNKNAPKYNYYGGRGINIYSEWRDFTEFEKWSLNNGYKDYLTIDRINNNEGYNPSNCRWVDRKIQANNTRQNVFITYNDETKTLSQWSEIYGIRYKTLQYRLFKYHWSIEKALTTPTMEKYANRRKY